MAHLIYLRYSTNFSVCPHSSLGTHEQLEQDIAKTKYPLNYDRQGYCIPDTAEWKLLETRIKYDVLPQFARDICAINLNPSPNKVTLWQIFFKKPHPDRIPNKQLLFIQWLFKWANRLGISPYKPCPVAKDHTYSFAPKAGWRYHVILGVRHDPTENTVYGGKKHDIL